MAAPFSWDPRVFHKASPPREAAPAGYDWLIRRYGLRVPELPRHAWIGQSSTTTDAEQWLILTPRHAPEETLAGHLEFALKWEGVNLAVLKALFDSVQPRDVADAVRTSPQGQYMRRVWFLFEWLTGSTLDLLDLDTKRSTIGLLDPKQQFALEKGELSPRHRVINNLPGTPAFCPLVRVTPALERWHEMRLGEQARSNMVGRTRRDLMRRAGAFLLLKDSRASFAIEEERPTSTRLQRWANAIGRAGQDDVSVESFTRLQKLVIEDSRFVRLGLRDEGGFVGEHDRDVRTPIPEHISAREKDLNDLMRGLEQFDIRVRQGGFDPVIAAACEAFGFIYIHPFVDGNGRLHRWLIHHVLAAMEYAPMGTVFPVSAAMQREIDRYRQVLQSYSEPLLPLIQWEATETGNVRVLNETADFYRYFDATAHAEFLYHCVEETVIHDIPKEIRFLERYDAFVTGVQDIVDMPARTVDLLHRFLRQNDGRLSRRAREKEFAALSEAEVEAVERLFAGEVSAEVDDGAPVMVDEKPFEAQIFLPGSPVVDKATRFGYWRIVVRPADFNGRRVDNILALREIMETAAVSYRGWPYPSILSGERETIGRDFIGFEIDSRIHVEAWRLYQSGLFTQTMAFWEDWYGQDLIARDAPAQGATLGIDLTIGTLTELFEFASRLAATPAGSESMIVEISAHGLAGRRLAWPSGRDDITDRRPIELQYLTLDRVVADRRELITNADDYAARAAREIFRRFGWDADLADIRSIQQRLRKP